MASGHQLFRLRQRQISMPWTHDPRKVLAAGCCSSQRSAAQPLRDRPAIIQRLNHIESCKESQESDHRIADTIEVGRNMLSYLSPIRYIFVYASLDPRCSRSGSSRSRMRNSTNLSCSISENFGVGEKLTAPVSAQCTGKRATSNRSNARATRQPRPRHSAARLATRRDTAEIRVRGCDVRAAGGANRRIPSAGHARGPPRRRRGSGGSP